MVDIVQTQLMEPISEVSKSQSVRLADVLLIGPLMVYAGFVLSTYKLDKVNKPLGISLMAIGAGTILYNGRNYFVNQRRLKSL